jgi:SAM-dependent methyltransferase
MTWLFVAFAVLLVLGGLRRRRRLSRLHVLAPSATAVDPAHLFWLAPGVSLDDAGRRAASAWAAAEELDALDLWPADLPASRLLALGGVIDPTRYRSLRLAWGMTAGHALLVSQELAERSGIAEPRTPAEFARAARGLKRYAPTGYDVAVCPGMHAQRSDPRRRSAALRELVGPLAPFLLALQGITIALAGLGFLWSFAGGAAALAAYQLQPFVATLGSRLRPRDLALTVLLRTPLDALAWLQAVLLPKARADRKGTKDALRPIYAELLTGGTDRFLEPRRKTCPLCDGGSLGVHLRSPDVIQGKPGRFTLERCEDCGHVFQNPRLSPDGLFFYYRDCYDGLGAERYDAIFSAMQKAYVERARLLQGRGIPRRWLDVGGGHGHFCCAAREVWPDARFDLLDVGEKVDEAERMGWADRAFRANLPEVAPSVAGEYDVVSMIHCLEHVFDPLAELRAARTALGSGGYLLVEIVNLDDPTSRLLGCWWYLWFQPQHLHLLSPANLDRLLHEAGFRVVERQWREAESTLGLRLLSGPFTLAALLVLRRLGPDPRLPWRSKTGVLGRARRAVWLVSPLLLVPAALGDLLVRPLVLRGRRGSWVLRVLAQASDA